MTRTFRKQTHQDFRQRVKRVDPVFFRLGERGRSKDTTAERPFGSVLLGFGWAYLVISVASNRQHLEHSLRQGTLSDQAQGWIMSGLAAMLAISGVMLALHIFRWVFKSGGKRKNSGGLLIGTLGALLLVYTPASVWQTGFGMMDDRSRSMLLTAAATVEDTIPGVDLGRVTFVSSSGK